MCDRFGKYFLNDAHINGINKKTMNFE